MNFTNARRGNRLGRVHFFNLQARLVFIKVLARQPRLRVVRPNERLTAGHVVEPVRLVHLVAHRLQVTALGQLVEGDFVADAPVVHGQAVVGMPQHGFAHAVVEPQHPGLALNDHRVVAPGHAVNGVVHGHVRSQNAVVIAGAFQVHMAPKIQQDGAMQRVGGALHQRRRGQHAVVDSFLETVHGALLKDGTGRHAARAKVRVTVLPALRPCLDYNAGYPVPARGHPVIDLV